MRTFLLVLASVAVSLRIVQDDPCTTKKEAKKEEKMEKKKEEKKEVSTARPRRNTYAPCDIIKNADSLAFYSKKSDHLQRSLSDLSKYYKMSRLYDAAERRTLEFLDTEDAAQNACDARADCKGYWTYTPDT